MPSLFYYLASHLMPHLMRFTAMKLQLSTLPPTYSHSIPHLNFESLLFCLLHPLCFPFSQSFFLFTWFLCHEMILRHDIYMHEWLPPYLANFLFLLLFIASCVLRCRVFIITVPYLLTSFFYFVVCLVICRFVLFFKSEINLIISPHPRTTSLLLSCTQIQKVFPLLSHPVPPKLSLDPRFSSPIDLRTQEIT